MDMLKIDLIIIVSEMPNIISKIDELKVHGGRQVVSTGTVTLDVECFYWPTLHL